MSPTMNSRHLAGVAICVSLLAAGQAFAGGSGSRSSAFAYDSSSGLLTAETMQPGGPYLQTSYGYDRFGNRTSATSTDGSTSRTTSTSYDSKGQFAVSATNPLYQTESWQWDTRFGRPSSHTDVNGKTTTTVYDGLGRKVRETRPDQTFTVWTYSYCSGVNNGSASCPAYAATMVLESPLGPNNALNGRQTATYYDSLGRVVGVDTQGFNGALVRKSIQYDSLGRPSQVSRPYFISGGTPEWDSLSYDSLGRLVQRTEPNWSTTLYSFHGLSQSVRDPLGHTTTTIRNARGQVVSVQDPAYGATSYSYDAFGNLISTTDPSGNVTTASYDVRGRQTAVSDPDRGTWSFSYNGFNDLLSQSDAKGAVTSFAYDGLGRRIRRVEPEGTTTWTFDSAANGVGALASEAIAPSYYGSAVYPSQYQRSYAYDSAGRPLSATIASADGSYSFSLSYDGSSGWLSGAVYPSGLGVNYCRNNYGDLQYINSTACGSLVANSTFWIAGSRDAEMHLTQMQSGNALYTSQSFDAATGRLTQVAVGTTPGAGAIENRGFSWDGAGNLTQRNDYNAGLTEYFSYDSLNRLTQAAVSGGPSKSVSYAANGNIASKSDVGSYYYGSAHPRAVQSISGSKATSFTYDANGNMLSGEGRSISYTSFNLPAAIVQGSRTLSFTYDGGHGRLKQTAPEGTTQYLSALGLYAERATNASGFVMWRDYVTADGGMVALRLSAPGYYPAIRYFHKDQLGSVVALSDTNAALAERDSYDAWGRRRYPNGSDDPTGSIVSQTSRGFTSEEMLAGVGLVHLNGRLYDPTIGRFTSADPVVGQPYSTQGWNRYAYVGNNPLRYTDHSGYCFLGCFWKPVLHSDIFRAVAAVAAAATMQFYALPAAEAWAGVTAPAMLNAGISGAIGGAIRGGTARSALLGGASAMAFYGVGDLKEVMGVGDGSLASAGMHGLVGGTISVGEGGKFGSGFLAAGFSDLAGPLVSSNEVLATFEHAAIGGAASVIGGGKFANGAATASFGYLFNTVAHDNEGRPCVSSVQEGCGGTEGVGSGGGANSGESLVRGGINNNYGWGNMDTLADHFARHGADFDASSELDYASQARDFYNQAQSSGYPTKTDANGVTRIYDPQSNTFGAYGPDGSTKTFFKPSSPTYWSRQPGASP